MLPYEQVLFMTCLAVGFIVSCAIPKPKFNIQIIHLIQILVSMSFGWLLFGITEMVYITIAAITVWHILHNTDLTEFQQKTIIWSGLFTWLSYLHIYRPFDASIHISGCVMLMTVKFTSHKKPTKETQSTDISLIEWLGFVFFIPAFLAGPVNNFYEYRDWAISISNADRQKIPPTEFDQLSPKRDIVSTLISSFWFLPFAVVGASYFPVSDIANFDESHGIIHRLFFAWIALWCIRCRYYLIWGIAEASYIGSNAARFCWHFGRNVEVWNIEHATSIHEVMNNWNRTTAMWLKLEVYQPVLAKMSEKYSQHVSTTYAILVTNIVSSLWHGFSAGYYLTFICVGLCTAINREIHRLIKPFAAKNTFISTLYRLIMGGWISLTLLTFAIPFQLHSFSLSWIAWQNLYFIGHLSLLFMAISVFSVSLALRK